MRASRASANVIPATGLKASDGKLLSDESIAIINLAYSDSRPLIGGSTETTPMQSFLSIPEQNQYRPVRQSRASVKPDEDKISESSDDKEQPMIEMSSSTASSPRENESSGDKDFSRKI